MRRALLVPLLVACCALAGSAHGAQIGARDPGHAGTQCATSLDELTSSSLGASELAPPSRSVLVGTVTARRQLRDHRARTTIGCASVAALEDELPTSDRPDDVPPAGATPGASTARTIRGPPVTS